MGDVLLNLLPLIIGAGVMPVWPIIVLFLLHSKGGLLKAALFVAGAITVRLVQGVLFGLLFGASGKASTENGQSTIVATLLLIVGILMLITAFRGWRKVDDPDAPPPKWMASISGLSAAKAFGMGALLVAIAAKQWVFTLSAIGMIGDAQMSRTENVLAFLFYVLAAQVLILAPIVVSVLAPTRSAKALDAARSWLERHNRTIVIMVSLVFGALFLQRGISGLIA